MIGNLRIRMPLFNPHWGNCTATALNTVQGEELKRLQGIFSPLFTVTCWLLASCHSWCFVEPPTCLKSAKVGVGRWRHCHYFYFTLKKTKKLSKFFQKQNDPAKRSCKQPPLMFGQFSDNVEPQIIGGGNEVKTHFLITFNHLIPSCCTNVFHRCWASSSPELSPTTSFQCRSWTTTKAKWTASTPGEAPTLNNTQQTRVLPRALKIPSCNSTIFNSVL